MVSDAIDSYCRLLAEGSSSYLLLEAMFFSSFCVAFSVVLMKEESTLVSRV